MLTTLAVANYRSLRNLIVPLLRLNLITGPNGSGKSSEQDDCNSVRLEKEFGETKIASAGALDVPAWRWASR